MCEAVEKADNINRRDRITELTKEALNEPQYELNKVHEFNVKGKCLDCKKEILNKLGICFAEKCNNPRCQNVFMTYSNKKVGSISLCGSVNLWLSETYKTFHFHSDGDLDSNDVKGMTINEFIETLKLGKKNVVVVDIYRPIFDIILSNFFLYFDCYVKKETQDLNDVINCFNQVFPYLYEVYNVDYFQDVYALRQPPDSFNFETKIVVVEDETVKYIKIRLCDSDHWGTMFKDVLGAPVFEIYQQNETSSKTIGNVYMDFKEIYKIPSNYLDLIKTNKQFMFYMSEEERNTYLQKFESIDKEFTDFLSTNEVLELKKEIRNNKSFEDLVEEGLIRTEENLPIINNCLCFSCSEDREIEKTIYNGIDVETLISLTEFVFETES